MIWNRTDEVRVVLVLFACVVIFFLHVRRLIVCSVFFCARRDQPAQIVSV